MKSFGSRLVVLASVLMIAIFFLVFIPGLRLARETAEQARARTTVRSIHDAEQQFVRANPSQGFACNLDDLLSAGWKPPSRNSYAYEIFCDTSKRPGRSYLIAAYPADKLPRGVWGFSVICSDQDGKIWQTLSRDQMRDTPTREEKAGRYDFVGICQRDNKAEEN